jgi:hypothetical protein
MAIPDRTQIDPACIDHALPHICILERVAPGISRIRVAGQALGDYLGQDLRGLPLCTLFGGASRDRFQGFLEQVFALPALVDLPISARWGLGRPALSGRILLLPLTDGAGRTTRALAAIHTVGVPGRLPRAFELDQAAPVRIENLADMDPAPIPVRTAPPVPHPSSRPWLRLVVSNG